MIQKEFSKQDNTYLLYIDATERSAVLLLFSRFGQTKEKVEIEGGKLSEELLTAIEGICHEEGISLTDISAIGVNPGPGSYTGLRIGLTTANLLAFTLNLPIFSAKLDEVIDKWKNSFAGNFTNPIVPFYAKAPHITTSKPRLK